MSYVNDTDFLKRLLVQVFHPTKYMFMSFSGYEMLIITFISILYIPLHRHVLKTTIVLLN